jgi:hypothetical protein
MRLPSGTTNDPWHWLYMISRGCSVLCVMTLFYFLIFIKSVVIPVLAIRCRGCAEIQHGIYSKASRNASNCLQIVILCILYAWHWHVGDTDNDFRGYMIPLVAILCTGFARLWIQTEWMPKKSCTPSNCLRIVIIHILYAPSWHIWTTDNDVWG